MENNRILIDEHSELYRAITSPFLLNTYIEEKEESINLYVMSSFIADILQPHVEKIISFYNKSMVNIIVDKNLQTEEIKEKKPIKIETLLSGACYLAQEYIETPFFVGESNRMAYIASESILNDEHGGKIMLVYGDTGTGKSHLLHQTAYKATKKNKHVYINSANSFLEEIKASISKKSAHDFITSFGSIDYCIIDDFQKFNNAHLAFAHDVIFEILNIIASKRKKAIFSSDVSPYMFTFMHDRIISRLLSGYSSEIKNFDKSVKNMYVDYYSASHEIPISNEIKEFIAAVAINGREVKMLLGICEMLHKGNQLNLDQLIKKAPRSVSEIPNLYSNDVIHKIYSLLSNFFNINAIPQSITKTKQQSVEKKQRGSSKINSIAYYLLNDKVNRKELQARLDIQSKHHAYYCERGRTLFEELPADIKTKVQNIISI